MPAKKYRIQLTNQDRLYLQTLIEKPSTKSQQVKRAYALLAAAENGDKVWSDLQIQQHYGLSRASIEHLHERLVMEGFERALVGKKREVFRKTLDQRKKVEAQLITLLCSRCGADQ